MLQNDYSIRLTHPSPHIATIFVCAMRAFKIHSFSNFQMFSASLVAQLVKNLPAMLRPGFDPWVGKIPWRRARLSTPVFWPGEFHRLYIVHGVTKSQDWMTFTFTFFQMCSTVLLTMLYIISPEVTHLKTGSLYALTPTFTHSPSRLLSLPTTNLLSTSEYLKKNFFKIPLISDLEASPMAQW